MLRPHRGHRLVHRGRVAGQVPGPHGLQADQAGHPLAVGLPVAGDHPDNAGQVTALGAQLGDLGLVLGEDDPGAAVGDDEGDVFAPGRGVEAVVAAPAHMIARSAYSYSMRVAEAIATRSSGRIPRASRPAAIVLTVSAVWAGATALT